MRFGSKVPGNAMEVRDVTMDFGYGSSFTESSPRPMSGSSWTSCSVTRHFFPRHEEVELAWQILDRWRSFWATQEGPTLTLPGGWGPECADDMMRRDGRTWRKP